MNEGFDELVLLIDGGVSNHCAHTGPGDDEFPNYCGDCYAISREIAGRLVSAGYQKGGGKP